MTTENEAEVRAAAEQDRADARDDRQRKAKNRSDVNSTRLLLAKARAVAGISISDQQALEAIEQEQYIWSKNNAVEAPYDPESMLSFVEITPHIQPCIEAYCQNIDGFGHYADVVEPWMNDLDSQEAKDAIRAALEIEAWVTASEAALEEGEEPEEIPEVTDQEVNEKAEELKTQIRREKYLFDAWFKNCCSESSFVKLRTKVRSDKESNGWGCVELLRDTFGKLRRIAYVPAYTVRPVVDTGIDNVTVTELDPITPLSTDRSVTVTRRFRRYVQVVSGNTRYFRSPGDPRVISNLTGTIYTEEGDKKPSDGEKRMEEKEPEAIQANELLWLPLHSARTPCPPPRWVGNLLQVLGGREADEVNYAFFKNGTVPSGMLLVSGGGLDKSVASRVESLIRDNMRGAGSKNRILVVPAKSETQATLDPANRQPLPVLHYVSLRADQQNDQVFAEYDKRNADRVGANFRLSSVLRGYTPSDLNRATAMAALYQAEVQVFQPEREEFDWQINKILMPEIGIKYLKFVSNPPLTRTPDEMIAALSAESGTALLPNEKRSVLSDILGVDLPEVQAAWTEQPPAYTLAGLMPTGASGEQTEEQPTAATPIALMAKMRRIEAALEALAVGDEQQKALAEELARDMATAVADEKPEDEPGEPQ